MSGTMNNPVSQPTPPSGNESPVVTEGRAGTGGPYEDFFSAYRRLQELNRPAPPAPGPMGITPSQQRSLDQLGAFGAALASSRSPNFMGAFGEGLRAVQQTEASQRGELRQEQQDDRQRQQANMEAAYRAAQEARQAAELRWQQRPDNPTYRLRLAQTAQAEAQARAALAEIGRGDRVRYDQPVLTEDSEGRAQREYTSPYGPTVTRPLQGNPVASPAAILANRQRVEVAVQRAYESGKATQQRIFRDAPTTLSPTDQLSAIEAAGRREAARAARELRMDPEEIARRYGSPSTSDPDVRVRPIARPPF